MSSLTRVTELLGIEKPIICAPLGRGATPTLLSAVAQAGGFAFVGLTHFKPDQIPPIVEEMQTATNGIFGVNFSLIADKRPGLRSALDAGVKVISVWQDDPTDYVRMAKDAGAVVLWTVGTAEEASRAKDMGVDIIVAQGAESGGHLVGRAPTMAHLPAIVAAARGLPVVAAGGIADGYGMAAAFALGAEAVWLGTRFVASVEAGLHEGYKAGIVEAGAADLVETKLFDIGWGPSPHRVLRNHVVDTWEKAGSPEIGSRPGEGEIVGHQPDGTAIPRYHIQSPLPGFQGDWAATVPEHR